MRQYPLRIISLNLEGHKHIDLQVPFFRAQLPDVLCVQEVLESDFEFLKTELAMDGLFASMCAERRINQEGREVLEPRGIAMLAKSPMQIAAHYYFGDPGTTYEFINDVTPQDQINKVLLTGAMMHRGDVFQIGTTHFTWSKEGAADERQRQDMRALFTRIAAFPEMVLCGDFNAPRGQEIFTMIAEKYKDNIPPEYTTSIDGNLHRRGQIAFMVDGLFSTPAYDVRNIRLETGVSDHCAIVAEIGLSKKK